MISEQQARDVIGAQLIDSDGSKVGKVGQLFLDDQTGQPEWVAVNTGLFGSNESFVPLADASLTSGEVRVPYSKDKIKGAPNVDAGGHLDESQEDELYRYYGIASSGGHIDTSMSGGMTSGRTEMDVDSGLQGTNMGAGMPAGYDVDSSRGAGHDTSGPNTDEAMTRSEQRLSTGTEKVQSGRARLRKWVETENVSVEVPVSRERATLTTEPITDANRGEAMSGPELSSEEHEVTLTEERAVVGKETVPVERVRLGTETVTDTETVTEEVGKERIEAEGDIVDVRGTKDRTGNI
jgi:uncharacterized protein (TIGR02271 family)